MAENLEKKAMGKADQEMDRLKQEAHEELQDNIKETEKVKENEAKENGGQP